MATEFEKPTTPHQQFMPLGAVSATSFHILQQNRLDGVKMARSSRIAFCNESRSGIIKVCFTGLC